MFFMIENNNSMAMVMLPQSVWERIALTLEEVKDMLCKKTTDEINAQWIESTDARKMLGVSPKTWQTYRDKRIIPFSQVGRKIYVRRGDLEAFMEKHFIQSKLRKEDINDE